MTTQYWLVKSEPAAYSWADLARDGQADWTGVRNYQARNNLGAMRPGDAVLFYESVTTKAVVGVATVARAAFPDPTAPDGAWLAVTLQAERALPAAVPLAQIKADPRLAGMEFLRLGRISVVPVTAADFAVIAGQPRRRPRHRAAGAV